MSRRDQVDLDVTLRFDPLEPHVTGACTLVQGLGGKPLVIVRDLVTVDELKLGHLVAMLLTNAVEDRGSG